MDQELDTRLLGIEAAILQIQQAVFGQTGSPVETPPTPSNPSPMPGPRRLCALVVGHSPGKPGACHSSGICEFAFNSEIAPLIKSACEDAVDVTIVLRDDNSGGYSRLPGQINALNPDFIISMHLNGLDGPGGRDPQGTETLHAQGSKRGAVLAGLAQRNMLENLGRVNRGLKPTTEEGRGGHLLFNTKAPCIICEPGFIESDEEFGVIQRKRDLLVGAYAKTIREAAVNNTIA